MKTETTTTWVFLLVLTISSALFSNMSGKYVVFILLFLAALKFISVAFRFMELKKAHIFWKIMLLAFLSVFVLIIMALMA
ncbi:MAG: hypothetical protein COC08_04165 [Maribacter sp.]|nr:MAG: hypothetical protein COC08_04165 [Maribacter sp.]